MLYLSFSRYNELFTESNNGSIIEKDHSFSLFKVFVVGLSPSTYTFPKKESLIKRLTLALLPKDPRDERSVMLEIRAGAGGDEACLWAGDIARMYERCKLGNEKTLEMESELEYQ